MVLFSSESLNKVRILSHIVLDAPQQTGQQLKKSTEDDRADPHINEKSICPVTSGKNDSKNIHNIIEKTLKSPLPPEVTKLEDKINLLQTQTNSRKRKSRLPSDEEMVFNYCTGLYEKIKKPKPSHNIIESIHDEIHDLTSEEIILKDEEDDVIYDSEAANLSEDITSSCIADTKKTKQSDVVDLTDDDKPCTKSDSNIFVQNVLALQHFIARHCNQQQS